MGQIKIGIVRARQLRRLQTKPEYYLWQKLRNRQLEGVKFRRQVPIGNYIVDFVCFENKIIVEVDGGQHNRKTNKLYDNKRTLFLEYQGYIVLRFWNNEILENIDGVVNVIRARIVSQTSS